MAMESKLELNENMHSDDISSFEKMLAYNLGEQRGRECVGRLLERYGSLCTVFSETVEEICRVGEINTNTALLIKLIAYVNSRRVTEKFEFGKKYSELELREFISAVFLGASVEMVYLILLDDANRVISVEHISDGTINASDIVPRKILEFVKKKKSSRVILAHNHPKGKATPSKEDLMTTGRLINILGTAGVHLCAHYIVADGEINRIEAEMLYNPNSHLDGF